MIMTEELISTGRKLAAAAVIMIFTLITAHAQKYVYKFDDTPVSTALSRIGRENPELSLSFIYKELDRYRTSAKVSSDNAYEAVKSIIGFNPITVTAKGDALYVEALQQGKYEYKGNLTGNNREPVASATILLLNPSDSTVITYGMTDANGRFSIACDKRKVLAKLSCLGYKTIYRVFDKFAVGTIMMYDDAINLKAVNIEAKSASASPDKTVYLPSQRQKHAAQNATDLLRFMAIPQIRVNPIDNSVSDNSGKSVAVYINGMEATQEELEGLRTADVRKVEYLEFPTDPRYRGAEKVVNLIVQEYAYGGYTKITAKENALTGLASRANVFSKFNYGKMSYDMYAGANNHRNRHSGSSTEGIYRLSGADGKELTVERCERMEGADFRKNQYPVTIRATYNTEKIQIRNTAGFVHEESPVNEMSGNVNFSNTPGKAESYTRSNPNKVNSANYAGMFYLALPRDFSIDITPTFSYSHTNDNMTYKTTGGEGIVRRAAEDSYNFRINGYGRKLMGGKHSLVFGANGGQWSNNLHYRGTEQYNDRFRLSFAAGLIGYNFRNKKISLNTDMGLCWEGSYINGETINDVYPWTHINLQYSPTRKNVIASYFQYASNSPTISQKASDILQDNEYMYITGNPYVENARHVTFILSYTYLPSNKLSLSAYGEYFGLYDRLLTVYSPYKDGAAVIRSYTNNGDYNSAEFGVSANLKLFDGKLQLAARPKQVFYRSTGIYERTFSPFSITAQATAYFGKIYLQMYYASPERQYMNDANLITRTPNYHSLEAGWSDGNLNIRLGAYNMLNTGWTNSTWEMNSRYYSQHRTDYGTTYHPRLNLSVTYVINYGKKVQIGNEVGEQSGAGSGILK